MHRLHAAFLSKGGLAQLHKLPLIKCTIPAPRLRPAFPALAPGAPGNSSDKRQVAEGCAWGARSVQGGLRAVGSKVETHSSFFLSSRSRAAKQRFDF